MTELHDAVDTDAIDDASADLAVVVEGVSKRFDLSKMAATALKDRFVRNDHRERGEFWAVRDVSFTVEKGETVGIVGHNGSGKSTLLKMIARTLRPTEGTIRTRGTVSALLELGAGFHPELTGRENVALNASILGLPESVVDERLPEIFRFADLEHFVDTPVRHYSSGMFARLGFSVAVHLEPDVLLIDEVLAVGDEVFQRKCLAEIARFQEEGRSIVVVSHAADQIQKVCDRVLVMDHGRPVFLGEPPGAIRVLRELYVQAGYESELQGGLHAVDNLVREPKATVDAVRIVTPDDRGYCFPGERLEIEIDVTAEDGLDDLVVALELRQQDGTRLIATNTDLLEAPPTLVDGSGTVRFVIERLALLGGTYMLAVGLHDQAVSTSYHQRENQDHVQVENLTGLEGLVWTPLAADWTAS